MLPAPAPCEFDVAASHVANTSVASEVNSNDASVRSLSDAAGSHEDSKWPWSEVPVHLFVHETACVPDHVHPNDKEDERKVAARHVCSLSSRLYNPYTQMD